MNKQAEKRKLLLKEPYNSARSRLIRNLLFNCLVKLKENFCYRCNKEINSSKELSVDHKISWMKSDNPIEMFWNLDNVSFSHFKCNCSNLATGTFI